MEKVPQIHHRSVTYGLLAFFALYATAIHLLLDLPGDAFRPEFVHGDGYDYHVAARNLYLRFFQPHPTRMFGFPLLTGWIVYFNTSFQAYGRTCYGINALSWLGSIWLLLRIGGQLFGVQNRHSYVPALLFGLNVSNIVFISQPITETMYTFLLLLTVWCWIRYQRDGTWKWLLAAFFVFCYTTLIRATATLWLLIFVPALLLYVRQDKRVFRKMAAGMALSLLFTLGLQTAMMKIRYDLFSPSNIGLLTYYSYIDAYASAEVPGASWAQRGENWETERGRRREVLGMGTAEIGDNTIGISNWKDKRTLMEQQCAQTWSGRKAALLRSYTRNLVSNSLAPNIIVEFLAKRSENPAVVRNAKALFWICRLQNAAYSLLIALFAAMAGFKVFIRRQKPGLFEVLAVFSASILLLSAISFAQGDRFHVVLVPFVVLMLVRWYAVWTVTSLHNIE